MKNYRIPHQQEIQDSIKFLIHHQFPKVFEKSMYYNSVLPQTGIYRHVNDRIVSFGEKILEATTQEFTISGAGSLIDYHQYGHTYKRPSPQTLGSCGSNSLCFEPSCFGFTEGVRESNNELISICWSLAMTCLKDQYYSDMNFEKKTKVFIEQFFKQPAVVLEAYQRTRLIQESVKVVCTDKNFKFQGAAIGGQHGISLPFYINPLAPTALPDISAMGAGIGGANLLAFANYLAPSLFQTGFSGDSIEDVMVYGLKQDYMTAKDQTASIADSWYEKELISSLRKKGVSGDSIDDLVGTYIEDPLFPTFKPDADDIVIPITAEHLEASTIAGFVQKRNPEHAMSNVRGLLFVPRSCRFDLVEPPKDDFSDLGFGSALNFALNTPGVVKLSTSLFKNRKVTDKEVRLGAIPGPGGMLVPTVKGMGKRTKAIEEAVRSELMLTYASLECAGSSSLPNVGKSVMPQSVADGFRVKSTMYLGTDFEDVRPVLLLFKTDTPRVALPITVCDEVVVEITNPAGTPQIKSCSPGNATFVQLVFDRDVSSIFANGNSATYRTGNMAEQFLVTVSAVAGNVVTVAAANGTDILPCCSGGDDYGVRAALLKNTGATAQSSEILKAKWDSGTSRLLLAVFEPLQNKAINTAATITLATGQVINVQLAAASTVGTTVQVVAAAGETCSLANLDSDCLLKAVFSY